MATLLIKDTGLKNDDFDMIAAEDIAQREKWGEQEHDACTWLAIIAEEFGEMSKAVLEYQFGDGKLSRIEEEAIQVATLALKIAAMIRETMGRR